ncbi:MAG: TolC family protein [Nitrospiraceae bacterium]|jgi:outer membrane protein TolC|nr:TolC family protein [Nitrospiraceae bacterium]
MSFLHITSFSIFDKKPSSGSPFSSGKRQSIWRYWISLILAQILLPPCFIFDQAHPFGQDSIVWADGASFTGTASLQEMGLPVLTIDQAVHLALERNPALARERAQIAREKALSIQAGELPDPKLILGEQYFPLSFNMGQSLLAMTTVGLRQSFSPWGKRALVQKGFVREQSASGWNIEDRKLRIVRDVRLAWIEIYRDTRTEILLRSIGLLWQEAFQSALTRYRQGTGSESDLLSAQFQKDTLLDTRETLRIREEKERHLLMRLMRTSHSFRISDDEPRLPAPLPESVLLNQINVHPALKSSAEKNAAQALRIQAAEKDKIPAFSVEGDYNYFMGPSLITATPNLFSVVLTMNLPVRPGERQDQKIQEEEAALTSFEANHEELKQKLAEDIRDTEASYRHLSHRAVFFDHRLLPEAHRNAEAALNAYSTGTVPMERVLETMKKVEETELQALDLRMDRMKEMAELDYLKGRLQGGSHEQ